MMIICAETILKNEQAATDDSLVEAGERMCTKIIAAPPNFLPLHPYAYARTSLFKPSYPHKLFLNATAMKQGK
jgi:hypothetical protein